MVHRNGTTALDDVSLTIEPGNLTAVIGPSGAGKTTLLTALAGTAPLQQGRVIVDGAGPVGSDPRVGFVPQDDILHTELPLRRTLRYAAALRISAPAVVLDAAVADAMDVLGLTGQADVPVRSLSGGQRKRASIACEILTRPGACFLDEPTSGLDPSAAADLVAHLRRMCDDGSTVVFTTHSVQDIEHSDRVVALAPGGKVVAAGTPTEVLFRFNEKSFPSLYRRLVSGDLPDSDSAMPVPRSELESEFRPEQGLDPLSVSPTGPRPADDSRPGGFRQWWVLTRRAADILTRNRLTLAILLCSPAAVIAMFAVLFRPGGFESAGSDPAAQIQVAYWLSFAGFFFGLTFGLLQVCTEVPILRRERHSGMRTGAYLGSKLALLAPILLLVNAAMLVILRVLDRIPDLSPRVLAELYLTMALNAAAALCLGLLASAAVSSTAQAALALPMLCFPAVLFSGAVVATPVMAGAGQGIAAVMPDRWAFEAIAGHLHVADHLAAGSPYAGLGASSSVAYWTLLAVFTVVLGVAAWAGIHGRAQGEGR
jgi:ABC-type multidrug transport system ATPase subunit